MHSKTVVLAILLFSVLVTTGCTQYLAEIESLLPDPPPLAQAAPRLSQLTVTPLTLTAGNSTIVTISFRYEDWNEDVGPQRAKIFRQLEVLSGNLAFYQPSRELWIEVDHRGRYGFVTFQIEFYVPEFGFGEIRLSLSLYDNHGNKSTPISTILTVR